MRSVSRVAALVAVAVCSVAFTATASAASSHKVSISMKSKQSGTAISGTFTGAPWGSGKMTGTLVIPKATVTFHTKLGDATLSYTGAVNGTTVTGRWTWIKGTKKLKSIKGSGTTKGNLQGDFTYTGTATY